ncbi:hypothetical protein [Nocardioides sp.]|uniref:hypothetical protein n=1 Tax=Nocardioides sp. TaxID=35761 RepID=UPI0039E58C5F
MFEAVAVLAVRSRRLLRVDVATAEVSTLVENVGRVPDGVSVGEEIYWTTMGAPEFAAADGGVHAAPWSGGPIRTITVPGSVTTGKQLVLADGWLYWGDREGCRVSRIRPDGSKREDLVVNDPSGAESAQCVGVAVDSAGGWLYWTQKGPAKGGRGQIRRVALQAPRPAPEAMVQTLWSGLPEPIDLAIDDGWLYWTDRGAPPRGNTLNRAPLPAADERGATPEVLADGFAEAIGLAVDADAEVVYVSDLGGAVRVVPLPGSAGEDRVLVTLGEPITGLAGLERGRGVRR